MSNCRDAMVQVLKYGGYDLVNCSNKYGAYIDLVPSFTQFVTGSTWFYVPSDRNIITVYLSLIKYLVDY